MSPLESYGCSVCAKQAPKKLREDGMFAERLNWLRKHYKESHPVLFRKWHKK
jgi:hypothetical protein